MYRKVKRSIAVALTPLMFLLNLPLVSFANEVESTTEIFHKQIPTVTAGERTKVYTEIAASEEIDLVRVYFKKSDATDYVFIKLNASAKADKSFWENFKSLGSDFSGSAYSGVLPALANGSQSFEYLILVKTKTNKVYKSQTYTVAVNDSSHKVAVGTKPIQVFSEQSNGLNEVTGFSDSIVGDVADLHSDLFSEGGGTLAGEPVAATAGGFTTTAVVVSSVAAVAVVGGVAALAGGGGSDGSPSTTSASASSNGSCSFQGNWAGSYSETSCNGRSFSGGWRGTVDGNCYFSGFDSGGRIAGYINSSNGNASLSGFESGCGEIVGNAEFRGSSVNGVFNGSGVSGSFRGNRQ